jgi:hypothetical protein
MVLTILLQLAVLSAPVALPDTDAERKALVARATRADLADLMRATPPDALLAMSERAVEALGTYSYLMTKTERVQGDLLPEQVMRVTVRERPFAVRLEFLKGPGTGRIVIFNATTSADQFRVHEAGFLGFLGPLWLPVNSPLARADSKHVITESGLGYVVRRLRSELRKARPQGGTQITHEGWNGQGQFCQLHVMPAEGEGFDAARSRICFDLVSGVPGVVESYDATGAVLEQYAFAEVRAVTAADVALDPARNF